MGELLEDWNREWQLAFPCVPLCPPWFKLLILNHRGHRGTQGETKIPAVALTGPCFDQHNPRVAGPSRRQMNPETLAEAPGSDFQQATRVHGSFLAAAEKRALVWMAERMPAWVNSDHLTLLGFAAQIATGLCYALAAHDRRMLLAAIVCLALNWFGDSLDGTLARVRQRQRPRYGFYVDHIIDSIGAVAMMGGLALSGYMHPVIATGLL